MRRTLIRRKPRTDPVTPEDAARIFTRDGGCLAPRLGGSAHDCWGRLRIEHVKREVRMSKRGELLGTLCEGHTEPGMRAGYVWCTDRRNREAMRRYLEALPTDIHEMHVDPCGPTCHLEANRV
jgi:hypothetical protein